MGSSSSNNIRVTLHKESLHSLVVTRAKFLIHACKHYNYTVKGNVIKAKTIRFKRSNYSPRRNLFLVTRVSFLLFVALWFCYSGKAALCDRSCLSFVRSVCLSVCLPAWEQDYCKSNQPISLKLGIMIEPTNRKNLLTFSGNLVPDTDSGSVFFTSVIAAE